MDRPRKSRFSFIDVFVGFVSGLSSFLDIVLEASGSWEFKVEGADFLV